MDINLVEDSTKLLVENGHRVLQIHRFSGCEYSHVGRLLRWAEFPYQAKIIDMGSGTGEVAKIMVDIDDSLNFTLVNLSQMQLNYSPINMNKICCNILNVPLPDSTFDAAMYCFSIGHEDLYSSLVEAFRLIKSGGVLFIYDMARVSGSNEQMASVDYVVNSRKFLEDKALSCGFFLDLYIEPVDDGVYGRSLFGKAYDEIFGGTIPAVWRFKKK